MGKFSILAMIGADASKYKKEVGTAQTTGGKFSAFMKGAFVAGIVAAGLAVAKFATDSIKKFLDFDKKITEVFTLIPNASNAMKDELINGAKEISREFGTDLVNNVEAMYTAISAGVPPDNVIDFLKVASEAAKGGVTDLQTAVGGIVTVINSYAMEIEQAGDVSDVLFTTVKGGITNFEQLSTEIGKVTPIASALGIEFSDVGAMVADLTSKLGDGSTANATTQLKNMLAELGKETGQASKKFAEFTGTSFTDFIAQGGHVRDALQLLKDAADANGASMIDMFGSIQGGQAALNLTGDAFAGLNNQLEMQADRAGAAKEASDTMAESFDDKLAKAGARVDGIMVDLGESITNLAGGGGGLISMMISYVENLVGYLKQGSTEGNLLTGVFDALASVMRVLIQVGATKVNMLRLMFSQFTLGMNIMGSFGAVMSAVFDPMFAILDGASRAFGAFMTALADPFDPSSWEKATNEVNGILDDVSTRFDEWPKTINGAMDKASADIGDAWDDYKQTNKDAIKEIGDIWSKDGNWEFLDPDKIASKEMAKSREEAEKIRKKNEEIKALEEKRRELAEKRLEIARKQIDLQKKQKDKAEEIKSLQEQQKAKAEEIKTLLGAQETLNGKILERKEQIVAMIQKEASVAGDALDILDQMAQKDGLRNRDKRKILELQQAIQEQEKAARDATEEGMQALIDKRNALLLIKETEIKILMQTKGLTREQAEEENKRSKVLQEVDVALAGTNKRIRDAKKFQVEFNQKIPEAKVAINGVKVNAEQLATKIQKAKNEQQNLTAKTAEAKQGMADMALETQALTGELQNVGRELEYAKMGADDAFSVDPSDFQAIPDAMDSAKASMNEFNDLAKDNDLVKLMNGDFDANTSSPIPVKVEDLQLDKSALKSVSDATKKLQKPMEKSKGLLTSIDRTLKGKFVNQ